MLFTQIEFACLLSLSIAFLLVVRNVRARKVYLLLASYYFYACWDWRFLSLIWISTITDYLVGQGLKRASGLRARRGLLITSLVVNLGILGFFKYFNFFVGSLDELLAPLGWHLGTLNIILPVGISFYTFQTLSYTIDVYRRKLKPCDDLLDFALFVGFFPQLVAGPIVRAGDFLPQLALPRSPTWERVFLGFRQFVLGLFKKVFIADRLAFFVDEVFANAGAYDAATIWLAVLCYAVQIYCDFSGYSDMAIGTARALGFDLKENFRHPYIATSIVDFWRRWHISLSTWLRDYLYIPLGGNRKGPRRTYVNLMVTMLLGGLWHGAAWTFVFWGGWHGLALVMNRYQTSRQGSTRPKRASAWHSLLGWLVTMLVVLVGWVFFRAQSFGQAWLMLKKMFLWDAGVAWPNPFAIAALMLVVIWHIVVVTRYAWWRTMPADSWHTPAFLFLLWWLVFVFPPHSFNPFIYFQF